MKWIRKTWREWTESIKGISTQPLSIKGILSEVDKKVIERVDRQYLRYIYATIVDKRYSE